MQNVCIIILVRSSEHNITVHESLCTCGEQGSSEKRCNFPIQGSSFILIAAGAQKGTGVAVGCRCSLECADWQGLDGEKLIDFLSK